MEKTAKDNHQEKNIKNIILCLMALAATTPAPSQGNYEVTPALTYGAKETKKKHPMVPIFWSATQQQPPLPFNPFPELKLYDAGTNNFIYDDREVDYPALQAAVAAEQSKGEAEAGPPEFSAGSGGMAMMMNSSAPILEIIKPGEQEDEGTNFLVRFETTRGNRYLFEQSADLVSWTTVSDFFADSETSDFEITPDQAHQFFRVFVPEQKITFPTWVSSCGWRLGINFWTEYQDGTFVATVLADGQPWGTASGNVADFADEDGVVHVIDGSADFDNVYPYSVFQITVQVTPAVASGGAEPAPAPAQATVNKTVIQRPDRFVGMTAQQYGIFLRLASDDAIIPWMDATMRVQLRVTEQTDVFGIPLFDFDSCPLLFGQGDWLYVKYWMLTNALHTHFVYFGHGWDNHIGRADPDVFPGERITATMASKSRLTNQPLSYVSFNGCRTALGGIIPRFIGYGSSIPNMFVFTEGVWRRFGYGWDQQKFIVSFHDVNIPFFQFVVGFHLYASDVGDEGFCVFTYRQAFSLAPDQEKSGFRPFGFFDSYFDGY